MMRPGQPMLRLRRFSKKSDHERTSGFCLSRALRWRSVMPPHTPNSTLLSNASAPHSCITGQWRQITAAFRCAAPRTNSSSGSVVRQSALDTQATRSSASTLCNTPLAAAMLVLRAAGRGPDTSCSLPPDRLLRPPSCAAIYATLCTSLLSESHRVSKLGGQMPIAQQSDNGFLGRACSLVPNHRSECDHPHLDPVTDE